VTTNNQFFTIKTEIMGDYEFNAGDSKRATHWKAEIEKRCEAAKAARPAVQESDKYKESLTLFKETKCISSLIRITNYLAHPAKTPEAVTSDEEGAVSAGEEKRPSKWSRRISGSFQRITGGSKDAASPSKEASEVKKDSSPAPAEAAAVATEAAAVTEAAPVATETAAADTAAETTGEFLVNSNLIFRNPRP